MPAPAKPQRLQLSRRKGWRMPPNTVKVDRSTRWGNPFRVFGRNEYLFCDASHRRKILDPWVIFDHEQDIVMHPATPKLCVAHFRRWLGGEFNGEPQIVRPCLITAADLATLRGKNIACWCAPGDPCHGDVLLKLANP